MLAGYGITGEDESDEAEPVGAADPQVMRAVADRLAAALDRADLELLAGLLHPKARWGSCTDSGQVLDWYRARHAAGVRTEIRGTHIRGDVIVLDLVVHNPDDVAPTERPDTVCQVFRIAEGAIADIRGYPTLADALATLSA